MGPCGLAFLLCSFNSGSDQDDTASIKTEVESLKNARRLSAITCKEASSVPPKDSSTVNEAVDYLQNIMLAQTPEERLKYETICRRMAKCASRLVGAERIPA
jgi:hypothetical protein